MKYKRYCNTNSSTLKCCWSHIIESGEYYQSNDMLILCNKCYDNLQREIYEEQKKKFNILWITCPFCGEFVKLEFKYSGGRVPEGQNSDIFCSKCDRAFYIEIDVRQHLSPLNE